MPITSIPASTTVDLIRAIVDMNSEDYGREKKVMSYEIIAALMSILEEYYEKFGDYLKFAGSSRTGCDTQQKHAEQEFIGVLAERNANQYFIYPIDRYVFKNSCGVTYSALSTVARLVANLCKIHAEDSLSSDITLMYSLNVFKEAAEVTKISDALELDAFTDFSIRAAKKIYEIIGKPLPAGRPGRAAPLQEDEDDIEIPQEVLDAAIDLVREHAEEITDYVNTYHDTVIEPAAESINKMQAKREKAGAKNNKAASTFYEDIAKIVHEVREIEAQVEKGIKDAQKKGGDFTGKTLYHGFKIGYLFYGYLPAYGAANALGKAVVGHVGKELDGHKGKMLGHLVGSIFEPRPDHPDYKARKGKATKAGEAIGKFIAGGLDAIGLAKKKAAGFAGGLLFKKILDMPVAQEIFDETVLWRLKKIMGYSPLINIAICHLDYVNFTQGRMNDKKLAWLATIPKNPIIDYSYHYCKKYPKLSATVNTLNGVFIYNNVMPNLFDYSKIRTPDTISAIDYEITKGTLRACDYPAERAEGFVKKLRRDYGLSAPPPNFKIDDYLLSKATI